jgi:predicted small integral membrane protein DUF2165
MITIALFASPAFPATLTLFSLAAWLSFAVANNIRDPDTNEYLLGTMFRMDLIKEDPRMGTGIEHRSYTSEVAPKRVLQLVVAAQLMLSGALWVAALAMLGSWIGVVSIPIGVAIGNIALCGFLALWTIFLCGGMWFGYWMKMPQVQQVHLALFIIAILGLVLVAHVA